MARNEDKQAENATEPTQTVDVEAIRAQIEAELRTQFEAEAKEKAEADEKARKAAEEAAKKQEAAMEREFAKQEKSTKAILDAEPKVNIHIPENPLNPNEVVPVGVNGVIYAIPVGQDFEVPKSIYDTWKYSYTKTQEANKRMEQVLTKEIKIL